MDVDVVAVAADGAPMLRPFFMPPMGSSKSSVGESFAILCGPVSGIVVADLDDETDVAWAKKHLPETPWRTKTARGEHWLYRHPAAALPASPPPWGSSRVKSATSLARGRFTPTVTGTKRSATGAARKKTCPSSMLGGSSTLRPWERAARRS